MSFFCLGDAAWYVIMVPACCLHPPSSVLRSMATSRRRYGPSSNWRRNDVKSWDESFLSGVPRRGNCFFSSFPASCRVSSDAMVALCLSHSEQGVVLGQWCRTRLLLCSTQNGRFFPSRSWMDGLFLATLRSTGSTYRRTGS